ncbi:hypothetical protein KIN20_035839 [Parelaphostrongylus tenuis]|uniref:Uncharacterized protein n=1 Tax=Parelaphostrongylus tenuis TaxID=148309 RepID=A0AAD5RCE4_PARTN|nr:hypothetical protein KIN20_035839 [Parelaphostrongylus tenuis]
MEVCILLSHYWRKDLHSELQSMKPTKLMGKAQQANLFPALVSTLFNVGDFDLEDKPCSGRPTKLNIEDLITALEDGRSSSSRQSAIDFVWNFKVI